MFYRTDDPLADYAAYDADVCAWLDSLPKCAECEEPIQSDEYYEINGAPVCPDCLENNHKHWTEDFKE